jgi:fluoroquinolone transport system permease protein
MIENVWTNVFRADAKRIFRDRFLLYIVTYLPLFALAFRWVIPWLTENVQDKVDITPYYPVICVIFVLILPYIMGCVLGLQLLEEKDEKCLDALAVTPFSIHRYFFFRAWAYAAVGSVLLVIAHEAMGIVRSISLFQLCVVAASFTLSTGLSALFVAILAKNQVQGFAVLKASGVPFIIPTLSFFVPQHWDLLFGVIPLYWPIKAYYIAVQGGGASVFFWTAITAAIVTQVIALILLYRAFERRILQV